MHQIFGFSFLFLSFCQDLISMPAGTKEEKKTDLVSSFFFFFFPVLF